MTSELSPKRGAADVVALLRGSAGRLQFHYKLCQCTHCDEHCFAHDNHPVSQGKEA
jgi:hypothetical protein